MGIRGVHWCADFGSASATLGGRKLRSRLRPQRGVERATFLLASCAFDG